MSTPPSALPERPVVGIKLGSDLYDAFRERRLLLPKHADFILGGWTVPSYREVFVVEGLDIAPSAFQIGKPQAG